jgi:3-methyladenine DNA glycosylase AlkD
MQAIDVKKELKRLGDPKQAKLLQGFFKTGKGEYGEGDLFLGIKVPVQREVAGKYKDLNLNSVQKLLDSKVHEHRMVALFIMMHQYNNKDNRDNKKKIFDMYLQNTRNINNWDLVDLSAPTIVGDYLLDNDRKVLYRLAKSKLLWDRRIAVLATFTFIKNGESKDILKIAEMLLDDKQDLMHKAVGWMLRELGKRVSQAEEEKFLRKHYKNMPRTMLRYAIERFSDKKRKFYMKK